MSSSSGATG